MATTSWMRHLATLTDANIYFIVICIGHCCWFFFLSIYFHPTRKLLKYSSLKMQPILIAYGHFPRTSIEIFPNVFHFMKVEKLKCSFLSTFEFNSNIRLHWFCLGTSHAWVWNVVCFFNNFIIWCLPAQSMMFLWSFISNGFPFTCCNLLNPCND